METVNVIKADELPRWQIVPVSNIPGSVLKQLIDTGLYHSILGRGVKILPTAIVSDITGKPISRFEYTEVSKLVPNPAGLKKRIAREYQGPVISEDPLFNLPIVASILQTTEFPMVLHDVQPPMFGHNVLEYNKFMEYYLRFWQPVIYHISGPISSLRTSMISDDGKQSWMMPKLLSVLDKIYIIAGGSISEYTTATVIATIVEIERFSRVLTLADILFHNTGNIERCLDDLQRAADRRNFDRVQFLDRIENKYETAIREWVIRERGLTGKALMVETEYYKKSLLRVNKCGHLKARGLKEINKYMRVSVKSLVSEWILCTECGFRLICPHAYQIMISKPANLYSTLSRFGTHHDNDQVFCSVCGENISRYLSQVQTTESYGSELRSTVFRETAIISKNIRATTSMDELIRSITNEAMRLLKRHTDPEDIIIYAAIYSVIMNVVLASQTSVGKITFADIKIKNAKQFKESLLEYARRRHGFDKMGLADEFVEYFVKFSGIIMKTALTVRKGRYEDIAAVAIKSSPFLRYIAANVKVSGVDELFTLVYGYKFKPFIDTFYVGSGAAIPKINFSGLKKMGSQEFKDHITDLESGQIRDVNISIGPKIYHGSLGRGVPLRDPDVKLAEIMDESLRRHKWDDGAPSKCTVCGILRTEIGKISETKISSTIDNLPKADIGSEQPTLVSWVNPEYAKWLSDWKFDSAPLLELSSVLGADKKRITFIGCYEQVLYLDAVVSVPKDINEPAIHTCYRYNSILISEFSTAFNNGKLGNIKQEFVDSIVLSNDRLRAPDVFNQLDGTRAYHYLQWLLSTTALTIHKINPECAKFVIETMNRILKSDKSLSPPAKMNFDVEETSDYIYDDVDADEKPHRTNDSDIDLYSYDEIDYNGENDEPA